MTVLEPLHGRSGARAEMTGAGDMQLPLHPRDGRAVVAVVEGGRPGNGARRRGRGRCPADEYQRPGDEDDREGTAEMTEVLAPMAACVS